jgi:aarF domain-containing kinase
MKSDITNMLRVCRFLEWAKLDLNFDQVSIMREYEEQVPLEFDFCREAALLQRIGGALRTEQPSGRVLVPGLVAERSTRRVLCLEFMHGVPFSALQRAVDPTRALEGATAKASPLPPGASPREMDALIRDLLESFGHQIFIQGVFHSDPHPGNLLRLPDGRVGLLDFGECKELSDDTRLLFARLTVALAQRNPAAALPLLAECGVDIDGATPEFAMIAATIMFDSRMDIPEAHMSPLDAGADEMRAVKVRKLPKELFMLLRVITLVRGMLAIFKSDVSASKVWEPYALAALKKAGIEPPPPPSAAAAAAMAKGGSAAEGTESGGMYDRMFRLAEWMLKHELPHDRKALTPCAMTGLTTVAEIAAADDERLAKGLKKFTPAERERCRALARQAVAAEAASRAAAPAPAVKAAAAKAAPSAGQEKVQRGFAKLRFARAIAAK